MRDLLALCERIIMRDLLALPTHLHVSYTSLINRILKNAILEQEVLYTFHCWEAQMNARKVVHRERANQSSSVLRQRAPSSLTEPSSTYRKRSIQLAHCPSSR